MDDDRTLDLLQVCGDAITKKKSQEIKEELKRMLLDELKKLDEETRKIPADYPIREPMHFMGSYGPSDIEVMEDTEDDT